MKASTSQLSFEFEGIGSGRAQLTWGQRTIWNAIERIGDQSHYFNIRRVIPVNELDQPAVLRVLRTLVERHQALRTHFLVGTDGPVQQVFDRGRQRVVLAEVGDKDEAEGAARQLINEEADRPFKPGEWPWRCGLVVVDGIVQHLTVVLNHQTVDGSGAGLVVSELRALLDGEELGEASWQPLDQVAYETTGEGAQRGALALRYWRQQLSTAPPSMFDLSPREPEAERFWKIGLSSPAAAVAAARIAARSNRTTSAVLLAASTLVLSLLTGHRTCLMQLIVANRFDPRRRALVSALYEDGLFVLDKSAARTFDELVEATFRAALATYRYGFYDRAKRDALIAEIEAERRTPVELKSFFNDARANDSWSAAPVVQSPAELEALTSRTELDVVGTWRRQDTTYFVAVNECPDACRLTLLSDTAYVTVGETRAALIATEAVLVAAAFADIDLAVAESKAALMPIPRPAALEEGLAR